MATRSSSFWHHSYVTCAWRWAQAAETTISDLLMKDHHTTQLKLSSYQVFKNQFCTIKVFQLAFAASAVCCAEKWFSGKYTHPGEQKTTFLRRLYAAKTLRRASAEQKRWFLTWSESRSCCHCWFNKNDRRNSRGTLRHKEKKEKAKKENKRRCKKKTFFFRTLSQTPDPTHPPRTFRTPLSEK